MSLPRLTGMTYLLRFAMLSAAACAVSAAATYKVSIPLDVTLEGQQLKPGIYKVTVTDDTAVLTNGKQKVETKVHMEIAGQKFRQTSVRYSEAHGTQYYLTQISIGGTTTKVVFDSAKTANSGL